jgi:hypothetical protein
MRAHPLLAAAFAVLSLFSRPAAASLVDPSAGKAPLVTVVDSPLAEKWLDQAGIAYVHRTGQSLGTTPVTGAKLLILPMQSVTTAAAVTSVQEYLAGGGKVIAVYWGTVAPEGAANYPAYQLCAQLGVRPVGWLDGPPGRLSLATGGMGMLPYAGADVDLPGSPTVVVQPLPGALPVGRWVGSGAAEVPSNYVGAVYLRGGSVYLAPNILRSSNDVPACRDLLFWAMQRVAPDFGPSFQARDRIAAAAAAMASLSPLLDASSPAEVTAGVSIAQASLAEARTQLSRSVPARAIAAADRARRLAADLTDRLKRDRERGAAAPSK